MDEQIKHCTEQRKKGEIECVNRKNDNMENDRFHEKANTNSLEGDDNCNIDSEGVEGPFGHQSVVDPLFSSLIDNAMFPLLIVSVEKESILYANKYAQDFFGNCGQDHGLQRVTDFWADAPSRQQFLQKILIEKEVKDFQAVLITAQKKRRHVLLSSRLIQYKSQQAIYTIFSDITERVIAQNAFKESENRYHSMYRMVKLMANTLPDLVWAKDLEDKYIFANTAIREKLLKCREGELIEGKNDLYFALRERNEGQRHTFGEICINSDEIVKRTKKKGRFLEDGLVRGQYLALDVHKAPMFDDTGELIGTVGAGRDVTADIKIQKALEESEGRFQLLANSIKDVLWIADVDLNPIYVTPSIEAFAGYTSEEFIRMPFISHMTPKCQRRFGWVIKKMVGAIQNDEELSSNFYEFECKRKNGTIVWVEIATSAMWDYSGNLKGFTGMIRDSTKRVQAQLELRNETKIAIAASQTKSEFLANMSHEIRTPMNGVLGLLQLLQETELTELQEKYVSTALGAGKSLLRIISDILDFSKIEAGKVECSTGPVSLRFLVASVVASFETMVDEENVQLTVAVDPLIPENIVACESRLKQILFNLIGNAVKFTSSGTIELDVMVIPRDDPDQLLLQFDVKDTGIGISKNMQNHLFEPFSQEDGSFRRKYGGTGLGLSIVKKLVEMMGGKITLSSIRGEGTTVCFTVPAELFASQERCEVECVEEEAAFEASELLVGKVLVVEDEQINAMQLFPAGHKNRASITFPL
ncbi:MAG: PAS domain S-box-containing protein [Desulforhopalus sp.]